MFYFRLGLALLGFLLASVYGVAIALLRRDRSRVAHDYARALSRLMLPPLGWRLEVEGREHLRAERPCVYIANHQSAADAPVLAALYPADTVVVAKKEIRRIPFFGWLYAATGNLLIDRSDSAGSVGRLREVQQAILRRRVSTWIFPEGTRGREPGRLLPFKKGAFHMALGTGVPLVPVVVAPLRPLFDARRRRVRPGTVRVRVLEPIPTRGLSEADLPALMRTAHERMQEALDQLGGSLAPSAGPPPPSSSPEIGRGGGAQRRG